MLEGILGGGRRKAKKAAERLRRLERRQLALQTFFLHHAWASSGLHAPEFDPGASGFLSQHGEDAWLIRLFLQIGAPRKTFLEIGIQDGLECNTACFAVHFGWRGVMVEGDPEYAHAARENYAGFPNVRIEEAFVTRENVQGLLDKVGADRQADLFSLDIDGNDYWIWEALEGFAPRVVVVEYNGFFGLERAVTIPYDPNFRHRARHPRGYMGASLRAYHRLASRRGYVLAGACACNAFFVRREALKGEVAEVAPEKVYLAPEPGPRTERILAGLRGLELVEVE